MGPTKSSYVRWLVLLAGLMSPACGTHNAPLDLATLDPSQDQWKIASHHSHEATILRQKAEESSNRAVVYERLFGPDSEWVTGARLLAQYYEEAAREQERLAGTHVGMTLGRPSGQTEGLRSR